MWWKVILEVLIVVAIMMAGGTFWGCVKSSKHLSRLLGDISELKRLIEYIGPTNIADEGSAIKPVYGSFAKNIEVFESARYESVRQTAGLMFTGIVVLLIISFLLGVWYFAVSSAIFLLLSIGDILAVAKNYNATHVHSLILNIYKWNHTDSAGCRNYCSQEQPRLMHLYSLVAKLPNKSLTIDEANGPVAK